MSDNDRSLSKKQMITVVSISVGILFLIIAGLVL